MIPLRTHLCRCLAWLALALFLTGGTTPAALAAFPSAPRLLPSKTIALVSITDAQDLAERLMNTSMGRMSQDPQVKPLITQLYGSLIEAASELQDRLGMSVPELLAIPQGEVTLALIAAPEADPAAIILIDAGDQLANARKLLERLEAELHQLGAASIEETYSGTKVTIYNGLGPRRRQAICFEKETKIVVCSDLGVAKELLAAWESGQGKSLADDPDFAAVMQRCSGSAGEPPQVFLYADPIGIVQAVGQRNAGVGVALAILPVLGLDGLLAVGGSATFDTAQFDSVIHGHVLLDNPRVGVIEMIALETGDVTPEPWVPADVASYTTVHWNVEKTFSTLSMVFNSFRGEGALGNVLERRILGPTGVDFEKEIIPSLDGRITFISWIERPITNMFSQRSLLGLKLKDVATVQEALDRAFELKRAPLVPKTYAGKQYYQVGAEGSENDSAEEQRPSACFGVLGDYLLATNGASLFEKAVDTAAGSNSLADELDFKLIASKIRRQCGSKKPAMISFERPEEGLRFQYEMATSQRRREQVETRAENSRFFRALDTAMKENPLPPFEVLRKYLAPGGAMVIDDESGIYYTAFGLRRK